MPLGFIWKDTPEYRLYDALWLNWGGSDKEAATIMDDLALMVTRQHEQRKKHGFETYESKQARQEEAEEAYD